MSEFKSNKSNFYRNTRNRVFYEIAAFCLLALFFWLDFSKSFPDWLKVLVLVSLAAYILIGLALYPKARAAAKSFSVSLLDDALLFPKGNGSGRIPYSDLVISKTKLKHNEIIRISLQTKFGQKIELQGLNNMQNLYKGLVEHGVKES